jgi:hypothetical protein
MKRTLLLLIALVACGDDAGPGDDESPSDLEKDAAREDATVRGNDAGRDAAGSELLDAAMEAGPIVEPDASVADAAVDAASFDAAADAKAVECVQLAGDCQSDACCQGSVCVTTVDAPYPACAKTCTAASECESGCCTQLGASGEDKVCVAAMYCEEKEDPTAPLKGINCINDLEVYDSNGTYMGKASTSSFDEDSVCDSFGPYGKYGSNPDKMWSSVSDAYSSSLGFSAVLGCGSDWPVLAYVSKYKGKADKRVVDPDNLCEVLDKSGF